MDMNMKNPTKGLLESLIRETKSGFSIEWDGWQIDLRDREAAERRNATIEAKRGAGFEFVHYKVAHGVGPLSKNEFAEMALGFLNVMAPAARRDEEAQ